MTSFVSVIIPVYNDAEGIHDTLEALGVQTYPHDAYEIIVADNGSRDGTRQIVEQFQAKYSDLVRLVIEDEIQSSYAARNKGVKHARGEILAFVDADMFVDEDWLIRAVSRMKAGSIDYLACNVQVYRESSSVYEIYSQNRGIPVKAYVSGNHFSPTCCLLVRKRLFDQVGVFDHRLVSGGDMEFGNRVYEAGIHLGYAPDIVMYHPARKTLRSQLKKSYRIGRGQARLLLLYPERYTKMQRNLWDPKYYLPIEPRRFLIDADPKGGRERYVAPSLGMLVALNIVRYLRTVAGHLGYISEYLGGLRRLHR